jgi:hypothetical protein
MIVIERATAISLVILITKTKGNEITKTRKW